MATVLIYLTDVIEGGETVFPHVPKAEHQTLEKGWSNCSLQVPIHMQRQQEGRQTLIATLMLLVDRVVVGLSA
jgi:hypothetical protein